MLTLKAHTLAIALAVLDSSDCAISILSGVYCYQVLFLVCHGPDMAESRSLTWRFEDKD